MYRMPPGPSAKLVTYILSARSYRVETTSLLKCLTLVPAVRNVSTKKKPDGPDDLAVRPLGRCHEQDVQRQAGDPVDDGCEDDDEDGRGEGLVLGRVQRCVRAVKACLASWVGDAPGAKQGRGQRPRRHQRDAQAGRSCRRGRSGHAGPAAVVLPPYLPAPSWQRVGRGGGLTALGLGLFPARGHAAQSRRGSRHCQYEFYDMINMHTLRLLSLTLKGARATAPLGTTVSSARRAEWCTAMAPGRPWRATGGPPPPEPPHADPSRR
jgi:hypothetical protein